MSATEHDRAHQQFANCIRNMVNGSAFDLRDSPKSFVAKVEMLVRELDAAILVQQFPPYQEPEDGPFR